MSRPAHLRVTKEQRDIVVRDFVQWVEDNMDTNSLDLAQLLEREQDYKEEECDE